MGLSNAQKVVTLFRPKGGAPWWLAGGINPANAVAVYQARGADSLAASYVNLANPGTYDAAPGVAPTWAAGTGWTFNGSTQYLTTGITPANTWSVLVRFSDGLASGDPYLFGSHNTTGPSLWAATPGGSGVRAYWIGLPSSRILGATRVAAGVMGMAGGTAYLDGAADGAVTPGTIPTWAIYLGARNKSNGTPDAFWYGKIQAFAIYNTTLSAANMAALSTAMAAL